MNSFTLVVICAGFVFCERGRWGVEEHEEVAILTNGNFENFMKNNKFVFVKFYAPWCNFCKSMARRYSKLAQRMKSEDKGVVIAKVDVTVEEALAKKFDIKGFPTLKLFIDGHAVDYNGSPEEDDFYNWIMKKAGPATSELKTTDELNELRNSKIAVLLALHQVSPAILSAFNTLALSFDNMNFHYTFSSEVKRQLGLTDAASLVVLRNFDDGNKVFTTPEWTTETMKEFVNAHRYPLVMEFELEAAEKIFGSQSDAIFLFTDESENEAIRVFKTVAKQNIGGPLIFSQSTITSGLGAKLSEFLGVSAKDANIVCIIKFSGGGLLKYKLENVNEETLSRFISDWENGKPIAHFKSENIPKTNDQPVKVVVGKSFEDIVLNNNKYVLLEAYAPWCGHCKKLEPIYNELAAKLANVSDLVIAKMDATANEHPTLNIKGFPTIKFYKKGEKANPVEFSGDRTVEGFIKFLEEEMGKKLFGVDNGYGDGEGHGHGDKNL